LERAEHHVRRAPDGAIREAAGVHVEDAGAVAGKEEPAAVGRPGRIAIESAVARDVAEPAPVALDDAHVPGSVAVVQERDRAAGRAEAWRSHRLAVRIGEEHSRLAAAGLEQGDG